MCGIQLLSTLHWLPVPAPHMHLFFLVLHFSRTYQVVRLELLPVVLHYLLQG